MTDTDTHQSRRDIRPLSRNRHAVTNGDVTPDVTVPQRPVPPTRPDPTRKYLRVAVDHQTNPTLRARPSLAWTSR
jgi:hypothetical protein